MTYQESSALMTDIDFRGRIKVACLKFADSIMGEASNTPAHTTRFQWAQSCMRNPDVTATQTQPPTVMDAAVQSAGASIDDEALQGAVETTLNKMM
jgi:hypothetical protein